jgi:hypothetical protein
MRLDKGGFAPISSFGCACSVGGGFRRSPDVDESIVPFLLLGSRVFEMSDGEWMELYELEASSPACLVMTGNYQQNSLSEVWEYRLSLPPG